MKKVNSIFLLSVITLAIVGCDYTSSSSSNSEQSSSSIDSSNDSSSSNSEYVTTFNRQHASNYTPGEPMINDAHVLYINWDGFARYYYDELVSRSLENETPVLQSLIKEGVMFDDLRNALPSITNPCQNMILSGATSVKTKNVYRFYDRDNNIVVQQQRENNVKILPEVTVENNLSTAVVAHYLAEPYLSSTNPLKLYMPADDSNNPKIAERGIEGDYFARFEQMIKVVKGEAITTNNGVVINELPKFMILYCDDIDALGHNESAYYGKAVSKSESERLTKVVNYLKEMDAKLGEFIQACKTAGVYDKLTIFLTTDHGMAPFGKLDYDDSTDYGTSRLGDLKAVLKTFDKSYSLELVAANAAPSGSTTVVGVGMNLNVQLTFKKGITDEKLAELKNYLLNYDFVGKVMTRKELTEAGYWTYAADMVVSPAEHLCFSNQQFATYRVRGQHDSLLDSASHCFGIIWGNGIKKDVHYTETAYNYDFGVTMAAALGITLPEANGVVLDVFSKK